MSGPRSPGITSDPTQGPLAPTALGRLLLRVKILDPLYTANSSILRALKPTAVYARGRLLDVGCGSRPYRALYTVDEYVGIDVPADDNPQVDVWADAQSLPFAACCCDTLLSTEVLEHVPEPAHVLAEAYRVLRPGGHLILTTPQTWGLHREPYDFYRYTRHGLRYLAEKSGFEVLSISPTSGVWSTLAQRASDVLFFDYARSMRWSLRRLLLPLCGGLQLAGLTLDQLFGRRGDTLDNLLVARRPLES